MKKCKLNDITLNNHNNYVTLNKTNSINDRNILQNYNEVATGKIFYFYLNINIYIYTCIVLRLIISMNNIL